VPERPLVERHRGWLERLVTQAAERLPQAAADRLTVDRLLTRP
jgi:hypothetical protein